MEKKKTEKPVFPHLAVAVAGFTARPSTAKRLHRKQMRVMHWSKFS
jgi:hypothetical protein